MTIVLLMGFTQASKAENLIFAGFTFAGEASGIQARFPNLSEIYKQKLTIKIKQVLEVIH